MRIVLPIVLLAGFAGCNVADAQSNAGGGSVAQGGTQAAPTSGGSAQAKRANDARDTARPFASTPAPSDIHAMAGRLPVGSRSHSCSQRCICPIWACWVRAMS